MLTRIAAVVFAVIFFVNIFSISKVFAENKLEYKLQPSDVLTVTVHNQPDLSTKTRVTKDGNITFPLLGNIEVKGLTIQELEQKLKKLLEANYLVNAEPVVFIEEYHSRQVSVIGEVKNPGKYEMSKEKETTLLEAIAMAGGFTEHANIDGTKVIRVKNGEKETTVVKVRDIINKGDTNKDMALEPDDIVAVPEPRHISVIGEVNNPGKYEMTKEKEMTLLEAIAMAGGFTGHANMDATKVIRVKNGERQTIVVKVRDIINKGDTNKDIVLEPDDVIAVPEPKQVSVMGEVKNPGKYEMTKEKEMTLIEAIAMAGGFTKFADANKTKIIRVKNGKEEVVIVAAKDIVEKGQKDKDIMLEPDDVVSVPESFF